MEKLIDLIAKLSAKMEQLEETAKEEFKFNELTLTQMHYLETINHLQNPSITGLAAEMNLTKPTITAIIEKFIEKDLVVKIKSDEETGAAPICTLPRRENRSIRCMITRTGFLPKQ